jgi:molecular chaperone GrpE (heat shock protein)
MAALTAMAAASGSAGGSSGDEASASSASSAVGNQEEEGGGGGEPIGPESSLSPSPPKKPEDPQVTALKGEIEVLERELKARKRELASLRDSLDTLSRDGYARRVAEMENMRRARSSLNRNNKSSAAAAVVSEFVPALDRLVELRELHSESEFARQYGALAGALRSAMAELGVRDYGVGAGDRVRADRAEVVDRVHSDEVAKGCVVEVVSNQGLELDGNVVRRAKVVASLGPQVQEAAQAQEEERVRGEADAVGEGEPGGAAGTDEEEDGGGGGGGPPPNV